MKSRLTELRKIGWHGVDIPDVSPVAVVDGKVVTFEEGMLPVKGEWAYLYKANDKMFPLVCDVLKVKNLRVKGLHVTDLGPIEQMSQLRGLSVYWANKIIDLSPLTKLKNLDGLVLSDFSKLTDLSPLRELTNLRAFERSGGVWTKDVVETLEPIGDLVGLEDLSLGNIRIGEGGLRPIARCHALRRLKLSNQFPTEDYAYLSVKLPTTECDYFQPWIQLKQTIKDKDVMVIGSRKPFLNFAQDQERIAKYERRFQELQEKYAAEG